jgi:tetratricopeptide (TPR) repeat protein
MNNDPSPEAAAMVSAALARLDRLEAYLKTDPGNPQLLAEAFDLSLQCRQWDRAAFHLRHGQALQADALSWRLKEGDLLLAQELYPQARAALQVLRHVDPAPPEFAAVVLHNLAYIEFRQGRYAECVSELAEYMENSTGAASAVPGADAADASLPEQLLQQLWLRSLHRTTGLERACNWVRKAEASKRLDAGAAAIASLIAIDAGDMASAQRWAGMALQHAQSQKSPGFLPAEVFVTQSTLALGARKADDAIAWADQALQLNHSDGRAWSGRAFAFLLKSDLKQARQDFARALQGMPGHIGTWHGQGWAQLLDHDLEAAQASFSTALEMDRNFAESHGGMAVVLALKQQTHEARQHAERAIGLDKNNLSGRYAQALLNGEVKDEAAVRKLAQRLLASRKDLPGVSVPDFTGNSAQD